jgi:hypothetical protein
MGGISFSMFSSFFDKISCCKKSTFICYINNDSIENSNCNSDSNEIIFTFNEDYILKSHNLTKNLYDNENIGKFVTDADGLTIYASKNICKFVGEDIHTIKFGLLMTNNLLKADILDVVKSWNNDLLTQTSHMGKQRYYINNEIKYILIEAYPLFTRGIFKGMKGIMLKVPKKIWEQFSFDKEKKELLPLDKSHTIQLPINLEKNQIPVICWLENNYIHYTELKKNEIKQNEIKQNEIKQNKIKKSELKQNEIKKSEIKQNEIKQNEIKQNEIKKSELKQNEIKKSEIKQNEIKKSEIKQNEIKKSELKQNEIKKSEIKKNEIKKSELKLN